MLTACGAAAVTEAPAGEAVAAPSRTDDACRMRPVPFVMTLVFVACALPPGAGPADLTIEPLAGPGPLCFDRSRPDWLVVTRVIVGAQQGLVPTQPYQTVEVMVRLAVNRGDTMAWASRCAATSSDAMTVTTALEQAARCAVFGGTGN